MRNAPSRLGDRSAVRRLACCRGWQDEDILAFAAFQRHDQLQIRRPLLPAGQFRSFQSPIAVRIEILEHRFLSEQFCPAQFTVLLAS